MRILLGASGAGKSLVLKLILGLLRPDSGAILVNGQRVDEMPEVDLLKMRSDIGMVFQENALFDSLTVAENVGYRIYEETDDAARRGPGPGRGGAGVPRSRRLHRSHAGEPLGRPAPPRRHRARDGLEAGSDAVRRFDDRPRSGHLRHGGRRDREAARSASRSPPSSSPQQIRDALLHRDAQDRSRSTASMRDRAAPDEAGPPRAEFMVLHEGRIMFHGTAAELLASQDPYLQRFLYRTLPPW